MNEALVFGPKIVKNALEYAVYHGVLFGALFQNSTAAINGALLGSIIGANVGAFKSADDKLTWLIYQVTAGILAQSTHTIAKQYIDNSPVGHFASTSIACASAIIGGKVLTEKMVRFFPTWEVVTFGTSTIITGFALRVLVQMNLNESVFLDQIGEMQKLLQITPN